MPLAIINEATKNAAQLIEAAHPWGHVAHIVLEDENLEDSSIQWCLEHLHEQAENMTESGIKADRTALEALLALTEDERDSAMAIFHAFYET